MFEWCNNISVKKSVNGGKLNLLLIRKFSRLSKRFPFCVCVWVCVSITGADHHLSPTYGTDTNFFLLFHLSVR